MGTLAGVFCAVYPFWVINTAEINDGVLASFMLALCLYLATKAGETGGVLTSFVLGLCLAGLALVRGAMLPFAFVTILWFLLRCRELRRGWFYALLAFLGFGIGVATWTVRNIQVLHEPLPIVEAVQYHLLVGNNPQATGGPLSPYHTISDVIKEPLPESSDEHSKLFGRQARDYMSNHPAETCRFRLQAGCYFFLGQDFFSKGELAEQQPGADEAQKEATKWLRDSAPTLLAGSLLAMLLLAALGWRWAYAWWFTGIPLALAAVWIPLPYLFGHAELLAGPRLPLDGVLLTLAAFAIGCLLPVVGGALFRGWSPKQIVT